MWIKHDKGLVVNLYCIKKMLGCEDIDSAMKMMNESYEHRWGEHVGLTFAEFVNKKRQFIASVLGLEQYF